MKHADAADYRGHVDLDESEPVAPDPRIAWISTYAIFAPLPPTPWLIRGLGICPGRPNVVAGYGYSGKTLASQSLLLSAASGREAWGHFATGAPVRCRHLDYEQGQHATRKRYQRLLAGMGLKLEELGDRLELAVFPSVYLNSPDAVDAYARISEGCGLVLLDALRGATPGEDENDSKMRACLDVLVRVSEKTGATFAVDHHAGKPKDNHSDPRMVLRGSSSIFDACGCVLVVTGEGSEPRLVRQVKAPAEAEGTAVEDFHLRIEDVAVGDNPTAGVRVVYDGGKQKAMSTSAPPRFEEIKAHVVELVRATRGLTSANAIEARASVGSRTHRLQAIRELEEERKIVKIGGEYRALGEGGSSGSKVVPDRFQELVPVAGSPLGDGTGGTTRRDPQVVPESGEQASGTLRAAENVVSPPPRDGEL